MKYTIKSLEQEVNKSDIHYSENGEDLYVMGLINSLQLEQSQKVVIDIGAGDLELWSNTRLFLDEGFTGIAVEGDPSNAIKGISKIKDYKLNTQYFNIYIQPQELSNLLKACSVPNKFAFASIDVDSIDHHLLINLLQHFRPRVVCIEINTRIPYGINYSLHAIPTYANVDLTLFSSCSISTVNLILNLFNYSPVRMLGNNIIALPNELLDCKPKTVHDIWYHEYLISNWRVSMPWNLPFEPLLKMPLHEATEQILGLLKHYRLEAHCSVL